MKTTNKIAKVLIFMFIIVLAVDLISAASGNLGYVSHEISHIRGGEEYTVSMWVMTEEFAQADIYVIEYGEDRIKPIAMTKVLSHPANKNWTEYELPFQPQAATKAGHFVMRVYSDKAGNTAYFDEIRFYRAHDKSVLNFGGEFYGCDYMGTATLENTEDGGSLAFSTQNHCASPEGSSYFCSYVGYWRKNFLEGNDFTKSESPPGINLLPNGQWSGEGRNSQEIFPHWTVTGTPDIEKFENYNKEGTAALIIDGSTELSVETLDLFESGDYQAGAKVFCEVGSVSLKLGGSSSDTETFTAAGHREWREITADASLADGELPFSVTVSGGPCVIKDVYVVMGDKHIYTIPSAAEVMPKECCPEDTADEIYCWTGSECTESSNWDDIYDEPLFSDEPGFLSEDGSGYACLNGTWNYTSRHYDQFNDTYAYCRGDTQCYFFNESKDGSACVDSGFYHADYFCEDGTWTSRTKFLAATLVDIAKRESNGDYTLFCDAYPYTLNEIDQQAPGYGDYAARHYIDQGKGRPECDLGKDVPCVNNFCVLNYTDYATHDPKVVVGTTLNAPIDSFENSFLNIFDEAVDSGDTGAYCEDAIDYSEGTEYRPCMGSDNMWVNSKIMGFIYSGDGVSVPDPGFFQGFVKFIKHPFRVVLNFVKNMINPPRDHLTALFTERSPGFRQLYFNYNDGREISGITEVFDRKVFTNVNYYNIKVDVCEALKEAQLYETYDSLSRCAVEACSVIINASDQSWVYHVEGYDQSGYSCNDALWVEMTAKIRMSEPKIFTGGGTAAPSNIKIYDLREQVWDNSASLAFDAPFWVYLNWNYDTEDIIAYSFDFGDGTISGTYNPDEALCNLSRLRPPEEPPTSICNNMHIYKSIEGVSNKNYPLKVSIMDKKFKISSRTFNLVVSDMCGSGTNCALPCECDHNFDNDGYDYDLECNDLLKIDTPDIPEDDYEDAYNDGRDNDCDGVLDDVKEDMVMYDLDGDGYSIGMGDCDDNDADKSPGGSETCDGKDNDCSGFADDGFDCICNENSQCLTLTRSCYLERFYEKCQEPIYTEVMGMSYYSMGRNEHASLPHQHNPYAKLCCNFGPIGVYGDSGGTSVINLEAEYNSHVNVSRGATSGPSIGLNSINNLNIECIYGDMFGSCDPEQGWVGVFSMTSDTNAHIGYPPLGSSSVAYDNGVCCRVKP